MAFELRVISEAEIVENITPRQIIDIVEAGFIAHATGKAILPTKYHYNMPWGVLGLVPGYVEPMDALVVKVSQGRTKNPEQGLPTSMAQILLFDPRTAQPLALMDGNSATSLRTAAAAALAAKYMARPDAHRLGIIGTGVVGRASVAMVAELFNLERVYGANIRAASAQAFVDELSNHYPFEIKTASLEQATRESDILITATPAKEPVVRADWVPNGLHISALGADGPLKQELESAVVQKARVVCDDIEQCMAYGEIHFPHQQGLINRQDIIAELGALAAGKQCGRTDDQEITLCDLTGIGIQDAAFARLIYDAALTNGFGTTVRM